MAKRIVERLTSDVSGEEIPADSSGGTVEFAVSGSLYAVDLTAAELEQFNEVLTPYVDAAQKLTHRGARMTKIRLSSAPTGRRSKEQLASIRSWAKRNGHQVSERGRIPELVLTAFDAAH